MVCERCGTIFCWDNADEAPMDGRSRKRFCSEACKKRASMKRTADMTRSWELGICERRGKKRYPDITAARDAAGKTLQRHGWVLYPYLCVCGAWHLTKRVPKTTKDGWFYQNHLLRVRKKV